MNPLYLISIGFALIGSWQLCQIFLNYTKRTYATDVVDQSNMLWLGSSSFLLILGAVIYFILSGHLGLSAFCFVTACVAILRFAWRVLAATSFKAMFLALILYSIFMALLVILVVNVLG